MTTASMDLVKDKINKIPDLELKKQLNKSWESLGLKEIEGYILTQLFPPRSEPIADLLDRYQQLIKVVRGEVEILPFLERSEVRSLQMSSQLLEDQVFLNRVLRSLYVWHLNNFSDTAVSFVFKLEELDESPFLFLELNQELVMFYRSVVALLMVEYFSAMPIEMQTVFLNSSLLPFALGRGMEVEEAVRKTIDNTYLYIPNRSHQSLTFASFLYDNKTALGRNSEDNEVCISYWIEQFDVFSRRKFDGLSFVNFFQEEKRWKNISIDQKRIIQKMLGLYIHLVNDDYVRSQQSLTASGLLQKNIEPTKESEDRTDASINWTEVLKKDEFKDEDTLVIKEWIKKYSDPNKAKQQIYQQIKSLEWNSSPYLNNLLSVGSIFEDVFGSQIEPLIYFDESANKFVWNE